MARWIEVNVCTGDGTATIPRLINTELVESVRPGKDEGTVFFTWPDASYAVVVLDWRDAIWAFAAKGHIGPKTGTSAGWAETGTIK